MRKWSATAGGASVLVLAMMASTFTELHPIVWVLVGAAVVSAVIADIVRSRVAR